MASGCILGECLRCEELVWEDERYAFTEDMRFYHINCKPAPYVEYLEKKVKKLENEIKRLKGGICNESCSRNW